MKKALIFSTVVVSLFFIVTFYFIKPSYFQSSPLPVKDYSTPSTELPIQDYSEEQRPKLSSVKKKSAKLSLDEFKVGHPITERHKEIFRENKIMSKVFSAISVKDSKSLRDLGDQIIQDSRDNISLYQGVNIIANCLDNKSSTSIYTAQNYYDTERASRLRRYIRRHCLN